MCCAQLRWALLCGPAGVSGAGLLAGLRKLRSTLHGQRGQLSLQFQVMGTTGLQPLPGHQLLFDVL